jgi:hypothetical protein
MDFQRIGSRLLKRNPKRSAIDHLQRELPEWIEMANREMSDESTRENKPSASGTHRRMPKAIGTDEAERTDLSLEKGCCPYRVHGMDLTVYMVSNSFWNRAIILTPLLRNFVQAAPCRTTPDASKIASNY